MNLVQSIKDGLKKPVALFLDAVEKFILFLAEILFSGKD